MHQIPVFKKRGHWNFKVLHAIVLAWNISDTYHDAKPNSDKASVLFFCVKRTRKFAGIDNKVAIIFHLTEM